MKSSAAARRYAKALFQLAKQDQQTTQIRDQLDTLSTVFELSPKLTETLLTPLYPANERRQVLRRVSQAEGFSGLMTNFCAYLIDRRRLVDFSGIHGEYTRLVDEDSGVVTADVISAVALDDSRQARLRRALSERTGFDVRLEVAVDPSLIGGVVAQVGGLVFDGSIRTQLDQLLVTLTKES
jgi:F-type H+-transporting ATPase subunit delta